MRVIQLTHGAGNGKDKACLMTASNMLIGRPQDKDKNHCVCPVIQQFIVITNDTMPEPLLGPLYGDLAWEILGTRTTNFEITRRRAFYLSCWVFRKLLPVILRQKGRWHPLAKQLSEIPETADQETLRATLRRIATRDIRRPSPGSISCSVEAKVNDNLNAFWGLVNARGAAVVVERACVVASWAARTVPAAAVHQRGIWEMCPDVIRGMAAIGDRRPQEVVLSRDELCDQLD